MAGRDIEKTDKVVGFVMYHGRQYEILTVWNVGKKKDRGRKKRFLAIRKSRNGATMVKVREYPRKVLIVKAAIICSPRIGRKTVKRKRR